MFAAPEVCAPRVLECYAFQEVGDGGSANRVGAGASNHSADDIAPAGHEFEDCSGSFTKQHSGSDIGAQSGYKFCSSAQTPFATAYVHYARNHHQLQCG